MERRDKPAIAHLQRPHSLCLLLQNSQLWQHSGALLLALLATVRLQNTQAITSRIPSSNLRHRSLEEASSWPCTAVTRFPFMRFYCQRPAIERAAGSCMTMPPSCRSVAAWMKVSGTGIYAVGIASSMCQRTRTQSRHWTSASASPQVSGALQTE